MARTVIIGSGSRVGTVDPAAWADMNAEQQAAAVASPEAVAAVPGFSAHPGKSRLHQMMFPVSAGGGGGANSGAVNADATMPPASAPSSSGGGGESNMSVLDRMLGGSTPSRVVSMTTGRKSGRMIAGGAPATPNDLLMSLLENLKTQSAQANADSLAQYQALLGSVQQGKQGTMRLYNQALGNLDTLGAAGERRIAEQQAIQRGQTAQDLVSRGLGNTTIRQNLLGGVDRRAEEARQDLGEGLAAQRAGLLTQKAGARQGFTGLMADSILSRQNVGPDLNTYLNLISQLSGTMQR